jgi:flagellar protein FliO/FliZ
MDTQSLLLAGLVLVVLCTALLVAPRLIRSLGFDPAMRPGRRLAVIEASAIDPRRRLVLARCDGREVLLLIGGPTDTVVGWLPPASSAHHGARPQASAVDDLA